MSLKFGIYLVEQRIISPEQFCGLVKIQQDSAKTIPSIALRTNMMTIKQVAQVMDLVDANPEKSFLRIAMEQDLIDRADADQLMHLQQEGTPSIRNLVVECGLLTQRQTSVLYLHFERVGANAIKRKPAVQEPHPTPPTPQPTGPKRSAPRRPKFKQRPVVVRQLNKS